MLWNTYLDKRSRIKSKTSPNSPDDILVLPKIRASMIIAFDANWSFWSNLTQTEHTRISGEGSAEATPKVSSPSPSRDGSSLNKISFSHCDCLSLSIETAPDFHFERFKVHGWYVTMYYTYIYIYLLKVWRTHTHTYTHAYVTLPLCFNTGKRDTNEFISLLICVTP